MTGLRSFDIHRTWEDWLGMALGAVIAVSPWLAGQMESSAVMWNAVIIGALVLLMAELELTNLQRWQETVQVACGFWLIASPFALGYSAAGALRYWHFILGAAVVLLALLQLWQDWKLNDRELARHGQ